MAVKVFLFRLLDGLLAFEFAGQIADELFVH